jgi:hypothetical protein
VVRLADGSYAAPGSVGALNTQRLPAYHRLDLRATRRYVLKRGELRFFVDVFNVYDRPNQAGATYNVTLNGSTANVVKSPSTPFPNLPSAGISWEF